MFDDIALYGNRLTLERSNLVFERAGDFERDFGAGEFELFDEDLLLAACGVPGSIHGDGADDGLGFAFGLGGGAGDQ